MTPLKRAIPLFDSEWACRCDGSIKLRMKYCTKFPVKLISFLSKYLVFQLDVSENKCVYDSSAVVLPSSHISTFFVNMKRAKGNSEFVKFLNICMTKKMRAWDFDAFKTGSLLISGCSQMLPSQFSQEGLRFAVTNGSQCTWLQLLQPWLL